LPESLPEPFYATLGGKREGEMLSNSKSLFGEERIEEKKLCVSRRFYLQKRETRAGTNPGKFK